MLENEIEVSNNWKDITEAIDQWLKTYYKSTLYIEVTRNRSNCRIVTRPNLLESYSGCALGNCSE